MSDQDKIVQSVTGTWINKCEFSDGEELIGIVHLGKKDNRDHLQYWGENFNRDGQFKGTFSSELLEISWPEIKFTYGNSGDSEKFDSGTVVLNFTPIKDSPPMKFTATVEDHSIKDIVCFESYRITDEVNFQLDENIKERANQLTTFISEKFDKR